MITRIKGYDKNRILYIIEATLEYLISILIAGSFLATLTKELGFSDSLTGILSSIISLGCVFQLLSVLIMRKRLKGIVVVFSIINQFLFMFLYVIPIFPISSIIKTCLFIVCIISAYLIYYIVHPKKVGWLISMVDDNHRGSFTANKEIISLVSGMVFTFFMGAVIDHFKANGNIKIAFIISAAVILILTAMHTISMCFIDDCKKFNIRQEKGYLKKNIVDLFKNKKVLVVTTVFAIYYIAKDISMPFYGTYLINELGCSLKYVSILSICSSVARILVSRYWGRYADKNSFALMLEKCFIIMAIGLIFIIFAVPSNGKIMFFFYYVFNGIAMGGVNSAFTNMIFDYVPFEKRSDSLALCQSVSGILGFLTTILVSPIVTAIQANGNSVLGFTLYAQQFLTAISLIFMIVCVVYIRKVIINNLCVTI